MKLEVILSNQDAEKLRRALRFEGYRDEVPNPDFVRVPRMISNPDFDESDETSLPTIPNPDFGKSPKMIANPESVDEFAAKWVERIVRKIIRRGEMIEAERNRPNV